MLPCVLAGKTSINNSNTYNRYLRVCMQRRLTKVTWVPHPSIFSGAYGGAAKGEVTHPSRVVSGAP